MPGTVASGTTV